MRKYRLLVQVLPFMLIMLLPSEVQSRASDFGHGTIGMQGSIIDTPCAIVVNDIDQAIEMDVETTGELEHDAHGPERIFRIHLTNCTLKSQIPGMTDQNRFRVTFDGIPDGELFGVVGASGMGVKISDHDGHIARPGIPLPGAMLTSKGQVLEYTLKIVEDRHHLHAGNYRAAVRFKIDYF